MTIAATLQNYLDRKHVNYQLIEHPRAETAFESAKAAHIPPKRMAKAVVLKDDDGYLMAVVPADRDVDIDLINRKMGRTLMLADESELNLLFFDCESGAIPALGQAYNMKLVWDDSFTKEPDCYIEAGDHHALIYLSSQDFMELMRDNTHGMISN